MHDLGLSPIALASPQKEVTPENNLDSCQEAWALEFDR